MHVVVVGGGAAGYFFAANAVLMQPSISITLLEQGTKVLSKVRISGGGRCNLTHACFDPQDLIQYYPRGQWELLGPFYHFGPQQTIEWFEGRGVATKTEADGRMFPVTDNSQSIIDCLTEAIGQGQVEVRRSTKVKNIKPIAEGAEGFWVETLTGEPIKADKLFVASGSSKQIWQTLEHLKLQIVPPVPSLFTFQIRDERLKGLAGVSVPNARVQLSEAKLDTEGPLLITHKGLSGPAILKLSAWGAPYFHSVDYKANITVDFCPELSIADLKRFREEEGKKLVSNYQLLGLPKRLCASLLAGADVDVQQKWASVSNQTIQKIAAAMKQVAFRVLGQNRFKEEFVTAGGVDLKEIDFTNFSSIRYPNMHLAGEVLNIDAVTGGFNFQAAWTGAYLAAAGLVKGEEGA